jgi:hypothetical protein
MDPKKAAELLAKLGIHLGDGLNGWDDFGARLEAAVATKSGGGTDVEPGTDADAGDGDGLGTTIEGGASETTASPPVMMSQIEARTATLIGAERGELIRRVDRLIRTGRVDGPTHRKLKAAVSAANLSFGTSGQLNYDPVIARIEAYESLPANAAIKAVGGKPADLSQAKPVDLPAGMKPHDGKADALAFLRKKINSNAETVAS